MFPEYLATGPLDVTCILLDTLSQYLKGEREAEVIFLWLAADKQWADPKFQCLGALLVGVRSLQLWLW